MAWTTISYPFGSVLTSAKMTNLYNNFAAFAAKDASGPVLADAYVTNAMLANNSVTAGKIAAGSVAASEISSAAVGESELANNAVHTVELSTGTATTSTTSTSLIFTMTGGMYVFSTQIKISNAAYFAACYGAYTNINPITNSTSYITLMRIGSSSASATTTALWRYINASPPHDMGNGNIPAFIFAVIDNATGDVESISFANEPVWLANGPTKAMPDFIDKTDKNNPRKIKIVKEIPASFAALEHVERLIAISELPDVEVEITNDIIHADKDIIPHPFMGNDLVGKTVVMLDPVSNAVQTLSLLDKAGEDVHTIIRNKYITLGNTSLNRVTPSGVLIPETKWKLSV